MNRELPTINQQNKLVLSAERILTCPDSGKGEEEWINRISNMDNVIYNICIKNACLTIYIKTWDKTIKQVEFLDYFGFKDKNSIGREIGDVVLQTNSALLEELKQDIINGDVSTISVKRIYWC